MPARNEKSGLLTVAVGLSALVTVGLAAIAFAPRPAQPERVAAPGPSVWLSDLATQPVQTAFAAPEFRDPPVQRLIPPPAVGERVVPPLVPLPPVETAAVQPATPPLPDIVAPAALALATSPFPPGRPERAVAEPAPEPVLADASAPGTSRAPLPRPASVARLDTMVLASLTPEPATPAPSLSIPQPDLRALAGNPCETARAIPNRSRRAATGGDFVQSVAALGGSARDRAVVEQVVAGNVPDFLRRLVPVRFDGTDARGRDVQITLCVTPDYLAVGSDDDFVRVPLGLPAAMEVAQRFDMVLPTTRMVDAIYAQAQLRLSPATMDPGNQMSSTAYFQRHNATIERQRRSEGGRLGQLVAGHKKDLVLTNRLTSAPGRVAIYGWHRGMGRPIQPLSTVHGAGYADYSHGIRLVSRTAYVNGRAMDLRDLLGDQRMAGLLSNEGTISSARLLASL